jgi:hypothetical protein
VAWKSYLTTTREIVMTRIQNMDVAAAVNALVLGLTCEIHHTYEGDYYHYDKYTKEIIKQGHEDENQYEDDYGDWIDESTDDEPQGSPEEFIEDWVYTSSIKLWQVVFSNTVRSYE